MRPDPAHEKEQVNMEGLDKLQRALDHRFRDADLLLKGLREIYLRNI